MKRSVIFLVYIFAFANAAQPPRVSKIYRSDYTYNKDTDAFYKLHIEQSNLRNARARCENEGAKLMGLTDPYWEKDVVQLHAMMKKYPDIGNYVWVESDEQVHESAEENAIINFGETEPNEDDYNYAMPIPKEYEVVDRQGEIKTVLSRFHIYPFICKVQAKDALYDAMCDVYASGYEYVTSVGSCYRIPRFVYSWNQAYAECQAEGAHLVVLNSEAEHLAVKTILQKTRLLMDAYSPYYYIAGFRAIKPDRTFRTIFNQTLEEAGYSQWADTEPNNFGGREYCGSLYEGDGKLNDHDCTKNYGFVCEKERPAA